MRFLLDTNILIPLEDSQVELEESYAQFVRIAHVNGHVFVYHPASEEDIQEDRNESRKAQTLSRLRQYTRHEETIGCPWNSDQTNRNDAADNRILYALDLEAAHYLVTEDRGIHNKAVERGLDQRVLTIQTACDLLLRLHPQGRVRLPNIEDVPLYSLTPNLPSSFFDSLREAYPGFDDWFRNKARNNERAWVTWNDDRTELGGVCIYFRQTNERITEEGLVLPGDSLKLATFKVAASVRGRKIGELFLKAAFKHATSHSLQHIFIHGDSDRHHFLFQLLEDFGFERVGYHPGSNDRDVVLVKKHPVEPPHIQLEPFEYHKKYFPHFRQDPDVSKFLVPIIPRFHEILFPDYQPRQGTLGLETAGYAGNAIKLAYLCHAQTRVINRGDLVLFYRSGDERRITSIGVVEHYSRYNDADSVVERVKRRTVYSLAEISDMARRPVKVMLFRLVRHFEQPIDSRTLIQRRILRGPPQSITKLDDEHFNQIINFA